MKSMTLKPGGHAPEYSSPKMRLFLIQPETAFLGTYIPGGNIPALDEGDVPEDLWG